MEKVEQAKNDKQSGSDAIRHPPPRCPSAISDGLRKRRSERTNYKIRKAFATPLF